MDVPQNVPQNRPDTLDAATEMKVEGRQNFFKNKMSFGGYAVTEVSRGWVRKTKLSLFGYTKKKAQQNYEFNMTSPSKRKWACQCLNGMKEQDLGGFFPDIAGGITVELAYESSLGAVLTPEGGGPEWSLAMNTEPTSRKALKRLITEGTIEPLSIASGLLTDGKAQIMIEPISKYEGSPLPSENPTGYLFIMDNRVVAGVETINKGAVWILDTVPELPREAIATAATALMLYKPLSE